jgi:hypothetical protein
MGGYECACCKAVGCQSASGIESKPSEPQKRGSRDGHRQVVRDIGRGPITEPSSYDKRRGKR